MVRVLTVGVTGPLEAYADGFSQSLLAQGFSRLSAANQLRVFAHLSRWLGKRRLRAKYFTEKRALEFLCARRRAGYTCWCSRRGLDRIFEHLRALGVFPLQPPERPRGTVERLIARYASYLSQERGLAQTTIRRRADCARRFLTEFGATQAALRAVSPPDVHDFLRMASRDYSPKSLAVFGSDLRSFFRFLLVEAVVHRALAEAVPSAPGWGHDAIPCGISAREAQRLIDSCDRRTVIGRRDYAVMVLLTRLGLRAGEALALTIEDIDWRQGEIVVHGKGAKRDRLPLPKDVGEALSGYLRHRPHVTERRLFLRDRAPYSPLRSIGFIVVEASKRAGIERVWPHRLRRTAATEMLRRGASLEEIAEVLRHTVTATTAIYAKVDRHALRSLIQPWPGARS
jgi:site-specific recombinase XerD